MVTDFATAELVKVAANAFLATKISFINAMAEVCEASGGDVTQLARAIGYDAAHRQQVPPGRRRLRRRLPAQGHPRVPGPRPGARRRRGAALPARGRPDQPAPPAAGCVQLAAELLGRRYGPAGPDLSGTRIAVLGATFKPNTDDVRDSPALAVAAHARARPAPTCTCTTRRAWRTPAGRCPTLTYAQTINDAVTGADLVCVLTEWAEFRNADPDALGELVAGTRVVDGRNCLDSALWTQAGWEYRGMGRP